MIGIMRRAPAGGAVRVSRAMRLMKAAAVATGSPLDVKNKSVLQTSSSSSSHSTRNDGATWSQNKVPEQ